MRIIAKTFVLILAIGMFTFGLFFHTKSDDQRDRQLTMTLKPEYLASSTLNPLQAKREHFFWANKPLPSGGAAIRVLENADLFSQVFPGYPEKMRSDDALWKIFFDQSLFLLDWIFISAAQKTDLLIAHSDFGGIEIFKRYGADVLILGNSESEAISPGILSSELPNQPKVLGVEVPASTLKVTREVAETLFLSGNRAKWAILGIPLSNLFFHSESTNKTERSILSRLLAYRRESDHSLGVLVDDLQSLRLEKLFSSVSWDDFGKSQAGRSTMNGQMIPVSLLHSGDASGKKLENFSSQWSFKSDIFSSITDEDCRMDQAGIEVTATLERISKLADQVLVILTPASLLELKQLPPCFIQNAQALLKSKASEHVFISIESDSAYGINLADYLAVNSTGQIAYLDQNHLNSHGVRLFSEGVARFLNAHGGQP